ncbi:hypothetical protein Tco_0280607, partial [Tanacetum coccineum]
RDAILRLLKNGDGSGVFVYQKYIDDNGVVGRYYTRKEAICYRDGRSTRRILPLMPTTTSPPQESSCFTAVTYIVVIVGKISRSYPEKNLLAGKSNNSPENLAARWKIKPPV